MVDFSKIETLDSNKLHIANGLIKKTKRFELSLDDDHLENPHVLISGGSGSGKTTLLKTLIKNFKDLGKVMVIIDFHGDMYIEGENLIEFTPTNSPNAINPFELETHPKKGGVSVQAEAVALMLGTYFFDKGRMTKKQQNTLEKLIVDTYAAKGIYQDDQNTWQKEPPTMKDLYLVFVYVVSGGSKKDETEGDYNTSLITSQFNALMNVLLSFDDEQAEIYKEQLTKIEQYIKQKISTMQDDDNKEASDKDLDFSRIDLNYYLQKSNFKTLENLFSYIEKIANLSIFNGKAPKLKRGINRMDVSSFTSIGKPLTAKFLGEFIAQKFFRSSMLRGEYSKLDNVGANKKCDRVLIFDESKLALPTGTEKENSYNIMNRIVTESRKYGLALVLASQRLSHYSEEILSNISTKILLGAKSNDYKNVARVFGVKEDVVKNTFSYKNKRTALIEVSGECDIYEILDLKKINS